MAIVNNVKRHDEIMKEAKLAWNWLRKLPEYKADYKNRDKLKGHTLLTEGYKLEKKYGFYPLVNPKFKYSHHHAPLEFFVAFGKILGQHPFDSGIDFKNLNYPELDAYEHPEKYRKYNYKHRPLPGRILIEINPKKPINSILNQIEWYLRRIRKVYKIKDSRRRTAGLNSLYKAYMMKKLGFKKQEIKKVVEPLLRNKRFMKEDIASESIIKRAERILAKAKLVGTNKL